MTGEGPLDNARKDSRFRKVFSPRLKDSEVVLLIHGYDRAGIHLLPWLDLQRHTSPFRITL